ncbi:putative membrane protein [Kushneria sinocarnis]|uniref:Protoporphyrinogen IX oxidase n=1 Tax=Kushneria sinocarnis TaxID=595502 RepID=A0A420X079_9GAMM|nr:CopD family protein [Kushneria sinocarnis]RKR07258.1 putative membrane protein [Kushneria sinocarnis]
MFAWILAFHLIAVICWFAALLYLPRLFVYHSQALRDDDARGTRRFQLMERRLYKAIMNPAMIASVIFGVWLLVMDFQTLMAAGWFYAKAVLVIALIGYQHICLAHIKRFADGTNRHGRSYYRVFSVVPVVILLAVVILSEVHPF